MLDKKEDKKEVVQLGMVGVAAVFSVVLIVLLGLNASISAEVAYYEKSQAQLCMDDCTNAFVVPSDSYSCYQNCLPAVSVQKPALESPAGISKEKSGSNYTGVVILIILLIFVIILLRKFWKKKRLSAKKPSFKRKKKKKK